MVSLPWSDIWTPDSEAVVTDPVIAEALNRLGWTQRVVRKFPVYPGVVPVVLVGSAIAGGALPQAVVNALPVTVITGNMPAGDPVQTLSPDSTIDDILNTDEAGDMDANGASVYNVQWGSPRYLRDFLWAFKIGSVSIATGGARIGVVLYQHPPTAAELAAAPTQGAWTSGVGTMFYGLDFAPATSSFNMIHLTDAPSQLEDLTAGIEVASAFYASKRRGTDSSISTSPTPVQVDVVPHVPFYAMTILAYLGQNDAVGKWRAVFSST